MRSSHLFPGCTAIRYQVGNGTYIGFSSFPWLDNGPIADRFQSGIRMKTGFPLSLHGFWLDFIIRILCMLILCGISIEYQDTAFLLGLLWMELSPLWIKSQPTGRTSHHCVCFGKLRSRGSPLQLEQLMPRHGTCSSQLSEKEKNIGITNPIHSSHGAWIRFPDRRSMGAPSRQPGGSSVEVIRVLLKQWYTNSWVKER